MDSLIVYVLLLLLILAAILGWATAIYFSIRYYRTLAEHERRAKQMFDDWKNQHEQEIRREIREALEKEYEQKLERERKQAIEKSKAVQRGQVIEQFFPLLAGLDPESIRYLGQPVDFLVFRGLEKSRKDEDHKEGDREDEIEVVLVEIKTGKSQENERQRRLRRAIESGDARLCWWTVRLEREKEEEKDEEKGEIKFKVRIREILDGQRKSGSVWENNH